MSPATDKAGLGAMAVMVGPGFESATVWALFFLNLWTLMGSAGLYIIAGSQV